MGIEEEIKLKKMESAKMTDKPTDKIQTEEKPLSEKRKDILGEIIYLPEDVAEAVDNFIEDIFELQRENKMIDLYVLKMKHFGDLK